MTQNRATRNQYGITARLLGKTVRIVVVNDVILISVLTTELWCRHFNNLLRYAIIKTQARVIDILLLTMLL